MTHGCGQFKVGGQGRQGPEGDELLNPASQHPLYDSLPHLPDYARVLLGLLLHPEFDHVTPSSATT